MRRLLAALAAVIVLAALASPAGAARRHKRVQRLIVAARHQVGTPYVWGGESPRHGFDCSGLVRWAYRTIGVFLPRTTFGMLGRGRRVRGRLKPGDAIFFNGGEHVALYLGGGRIEEAPHTGARVRISRIRPFYVARRYLS